MDRDRKSTPLKALQGRIWEAGYREGFLRGQVFPDVPRALRRWHSAGLDTRIFSSGSILAQKLLFGYSEVGDLTRYLKGYFDTTTGPKKDESSYRPIASRFGVAPESILFVSDVVEELDAARTAGMHTRLCRRQANAEVTDPHSHPTIHSFDEIPD